MTLFSGMSRDKKLAYFAWLAICVVWGTTYLAIRVALETLPVALLAGLRWTTAGLLLLCALPALKQPLPDRRQWGAIFVIGFLMNVVGNGCVVWAQQHVASGLTAVIVAMVPFWSVVVEFFTANGERLTRRIAIGLAIGFLGIVVLVWPALGAGGTEGRMFVAGVFALQLACLGWSIGTSYAKRESASSSPMGAAGLQMLFGGVILLAAGTVAGEWGSVSFTTRSFAAFTYLVLFGSVFGYSAYLYALKHLPVSTVSLYAYVNPVIAVLLGTMLLNEPFSLRIVLSAILVFAGIAIVKSRAVAKVVAPPAQKVA
jgi:drug/metabolite transporter (DMT)-like permease